MVCPITQGDHKKEYAAAGQQGFGTWEALTAAPERIVVDELGFSVGCQNYLIVAGVHEQTQHDRCFLTIQKL